MLREMPRRAAAAHSRLIQSWKFAAAANFHDCINRLWAAAARRGVSRSVFQTYTASLTPDLRIMDLLDNQPEFTKSFWDYLDILVTNERIEQGRVLLEGIGASSTLWSAHTE